MISPESVLHDRQRLLVALFFSVVASLCYHFLVENRAHVDLQVHTDKRTIFKVYWKEAGGEWSEERMAAQVIDPVNRDYSFRIGNLERIDALRIDPAERITTVRIDSLTITQNGLTPIRIDTQEALAQLRPLDGIRELTLGDQGLTIIPANKDPWLLYRVPELGKTSTLVGEAAVIVAIFFTVFALVFATKPLHAEYRFVPFLLLSALMLVAAMAAVSRFAVHPDEHVHVQAGEYYRQHNLPPPVGQAPVESYSDYGVSRLHSGEIAYFFAGKFAWVLQVFHVPGYLSLRAFNVALLFVLLLLAVNSRDFRVLLVPLLISPQIWYIFSYFNSEAYALFIVLLVAYQMAAPESACNRLLGQDDLPGRAWLTFAGLGLLLGLLLLLKLNFYFYCLFLFLYFVWRILFGQTVFDRWVFVRLGLVAAIGLSVFAGVRGGDLWLNDFDKSARLLEAREKYALEMYKPSTPLDQKHIHLQMKDRGKSLLHFIHFDRWGEKSFRTAFGVYGYTSINAPFVYYDYVRFVGLLLLFIVSATVVVRGGLAGTTLLGITGGCAVGLMAVAFYHAWTVDFQAQGRYFLPIVGMLSIFFFHVERHLTRPWVVLLLLSLYLLSLYNFLFVGLYGIDKYCFFPPT